MIARVLAFTALVLLPASSALAQDAGKLRFGGSEVLRFALYLKELKPVSQPEDLFQNPRDSMIVIWGDTSNLSRTLSAQQIKLFIDGGGAVLIASNSPSLGWGNTFGIVITGRQLQSEKRNCYHEIPTRPFIKPRGGVGIPFSPFEIVKGFDETGTHAVATDRPSEMIVRGKVGYITKPLATYPDGTRYDPFGLRLTEAGNNFAVSMQATAPRGNGGGRLLVMADQGVFANGMMGVVDDPMAEKGYSFDNANWEFANRSIDWLRGGPEPRRRCLFIENGKIVDKFAVEIPRPSKPPIPNLSPQQILAIANVLLRVIDHKISDLEDNNYFNRALAAWLGLPRLWRIFIISITVMFLLFALRWFARGARKHERVAALTPSLVAGVAPRGGVFRQRTAAQLEVGNLYEASRRRVRDRFEALGAKPGQSGRMPPILTANDLPDGPMLYQHIRWLWLIGYADTPTVVSPSDWDRLNALLERATTRAARGDWSFGQEVE